MKFYFLSIMNHIRGPLKGGVNVTGGFSELPKMTGPATSSFRILGRGLVSIHGVTPQSGEIFQVPDYL